MSQQAEDVMHADQVVDVSLRAISSSSEKRQVAVMTPKSKSPSIKQSNVHRLSESSSKDQSGKSEIAQPEELDLVEDDEKEPQVVSVQAPQKPGDTRSHCMRTPSNADTNQEGKEFESSYIKKFNEYTSSSQRLVERYTTVSTNFMKSKLDELKAQTLESFGGQTLLLKKKLSRLEEDKLRAKLDKENTHTSQAPSTKPVHPVTPLGNDFVRKKSKLEIEKEIFNEQMRLRKEHELKRRSNDQVFRLDNSESKEKPTPKPDNSSQPPQKQPLDCSICGASIAKSPKQFKCGHAYHPVTYI